MTAAETAQDRRNEQQAIRRMLGRGRRPDAGTVWYFHRLADGSLMVEGLAAWRAAQFGTAGEA
jgi:hypothetical protein